MKQNNNIEMNITKNGQEISQTQVNRSMNCKSCGEKIDQIYKTEYLCKECYNARHRVYNAKRRQKIKLVYDGYYLYAIIDTRTNMPIYLGFSTNIHKRHEDHFTTSYNTIFATHITENKLDKNNFEMRVLDLTAYKDSLTIDDVLLLEHFNIANTNVEYEILNKQGREFDFTEQEIERIMYLHTLIDFSNYIMYNEFISKKNKLSECESESLSATF